LVGHEYSLVPIAVADHRLAHRLLRDNHDLGRHFAFCLCIKGDGALYLHIWYFTLAYDIVQYLWLYYRSVDRELSRRFLIDPSGRQVSHAWNRLLAYTTRTYAIQHNKAAYQRYMSSLLLQFGRKNLTVK